MTESTSSPPECARDEWWRDPPCRRLLLTTATASATSSPVYCYNLDTVRQRARRLGAIPQISRRLYAIKANANADLLRVLHAEGCGFECVSPGEIAHVRQCVGPDATVLFTPNFAPRREYAAALAQQARERGDNAPRSAPDGVGHATERLLVTVDALHPLVEWAAEPWWQGASVLLRVDPDTRRGHHEHVRTGGKESKFGIPQHDIYRAAHLAQSLGATVVGLHAHVGSGIDDAGDLWAGVATMLTGLCARAADRDGVLRHVRVLDLGGGLPVPAPPPAPGRGVDVEEIARSLQEARDGWLAREPERDYELWVEPGRFMVAEAGVLLARVTQMKRKSDEVLFVGCDAGFNSLLRPILYQARHDVHNLSRLDDEDDSAEDAMMAVEVVGPICESGDVLYRNGALPRTTQEDDVLVVCTTGAYGRSMGSQYNMREPAREVVIDGGKVVSE